MPKNPLDAILSEVLGDDGGLLMAGPWPEEPEDEAPVTPEVRTDRAPRADDAESPVELFSR